MNCDVVIIGGGVAGGGLANNLAGSGLEVVVLETNPVIPIINRGDQLSPPSVRMLDQVGALSAFWELDATKVRHHRVIGPEGEPIEEVTFSDFLEPPYDYILSLEHSRIQEALLNAAAANPNVRVLRGYRVTELLRGEDGRAVGVAGSHKNGTFSIDARVVAGCDGPHSTVRQQSGIEANIYDFPYQFLMLTATRAKDHPEQRNDEFWTSSGFFGMFPLSGGRARCPLEAKDDDISRWRKARKAGVDSLRDEVTEWLPPSFQKVWLEMKILDKGLHFYKVTRHHASSYVADGVVLVGDAAHTTSPYLGMGMNMCLRDGAFASRVIVDALKGGMTDAEALRPYEDACREFNQFVIDGSDKYANVATAQYTTNDEIEKALEETKALDAFERIYEPYL